MIFKKIVAVALAATLATPVNLAGLYETDIKIEAATTDDIKEVNIDTQNVNITSPMNVTISTLVSGKKVYELSDYRCLDTIYDLDCDNDSYDETISIQKVNGQTCFYVTIPVESDIYTSNYEVEVNGQWTSLKSLSNTFAFCEDFNSDIYLGDEWKNLNKRVVKSSECQNYLNFSIWKQNDPDLYATIYEEKSFKIRFDQKKLSTTPKISILDDTTSIIGNLKIDALGKAFITLPSAPEKKDYKFDGYALWGDPYSTDNGNTFKHNISVRDNPQLEEAGTTLLILPNTYKLNYGLLSIVAIYSEIEATTAPTKIPEVTSIPTSTSTNVPSIQPTSTPTKIPQVTSIPTSTPTNAPSIEPTLAPTTIPASPAPTQEATQTPVNTVQVVLLSNGGTFNNGANTLIKNYTANSGQFISTSDFPAREGYIFNGFTSAYGNDLTYIETDNTYLYFVPEYNDVLTAKWKKIETATPTATPAVSTQTPVQVPTTPPITTDAPTQMPTTEPTPIVIPSPVTPSYTAFTLNQSTVILGKGEQMVLNAKSVQTAIEYKSSNTAVAVVNANGQVSAKGKGTAYIFVTANNITKEVKVTVKTAPTQVTIKKSKIVLKKGKKTTIKYSLSKGSYGKVTFSSSNKKVVSVSSTGKITAKKKGIAKIKIKTYNGKTDTVKVIVK